MCLTLVCRFGDMTTVKWVDISILLDSVSLMPDLFVQYWTDCLSPWIHTCIAVADG